MEGVARQLQASKAGISAGGAIHNTTLRTQNPQFGSLNKPSVATGFTGAFITPLTIGSGVTITKFKELNGNVIVALDTPKGPSHVMIPTTRAALLEDGLKNLKEACSMQEQCTHSPNRPNLPELLSFYRKNCEQIVREVLEGAIDAIPSAPAFVHSAYQSA